jgi:conjugative transfer region protein (TIGR03750 family)
MNASPDDNTTAHATRLRAPVTDRVNVEPAILHGMTMTEAQVIGAASVVAGVLIGLVLLLYTGRWQFLLVLSIFGPAVTLWYAASYLARIKRGRPDGYYTQALHLRMAVRNLVKPVFVAHPGFWSLGVALGLDLSSTL